MKLQDQDCPLFNLQIYYTVLSLNLGLHVHVICCPLQGHVSRSLPGTFSTSAYRPVDYT